MPRPPRLRVTTVFAHPDLPEWARDPAPNRGRHRSLRWPASGPAVHGLRSVNAPAISGSLTPRALGISPAMRPSEPRRLPLAAQSSDAPERAARRPRRRRRSTTGRQPGAGRPPRCPNRPPPPRGMPRATDRAPRWNGRPRAHLCEPRALEQGVPALSLGHGCQRQVFRCETFETFRLVLGPADHVVRRHVGAFVDQHAASTSRAVAASVTGWWEVSGSGS